MYIRRARLYGVLRTGFTRVRRHLLPAQVEQAVDKELFLRVEAERSALERELVELREFKATAKQNAALLPSGGEVISPINPNDSKARAPRERSARERKKTPQEGGPGFLMKRSLLSHACD